MCLHILKLFDFNNRSATMMSVVKLVIDRKKPNLLANSIKAETNVLLFLKKCTPVTSKKRMKVLSHESRYLFPTKKSQANRIAMSKLRQTRNHRQ